MRSVGWLQPVAGAADLVENLLLFRVLDGSFQLVNAARWAATLPEPMHHARHESSSSGRRSQVEEAPRLHAVADVPREVRYINGVLENRTAA